MALDLQKDAVSFGGVLPLPFPCDHGFRGRGGLGSLPFSLPSVFPCAKDLGTRQCRAPSTCVQDHHSQRDLRGGRYKGGKLLVPFPFPCCKDQRMCSCLTDLSSCLARDKLLVTLDACGQDHPLKGPASWCMDPFPRSPLLLPLLLLLLRLLILRCRSGVFPVARHALFLRPGFQPTSQLGTRQHLLPQICGLCRCVDQTQQVVLNQLHTVLEICVTFLGRILSCQLKKREGVPEVGTKPLKALRGYRASNRGSNRGSRGSNRGSKGSRKTPEALRG